MVDVQKETEPRFGLDRIRDSVSGKLNTRRENLTRDCDDGGKPRLSSRLRPEKFRVRATLSFVIMPSHRPSKNPPSSNIRTKQVGKPAGRKSASKVGAIKRSRGPEIEDDSEERRKEKTAELKRRRDELLALRRAIMEEEELARQFQPTVGGERTEGPRAAGRRRKIHDRPIRDTTRRERERATS